MAEKTQQEQEKWDMVIRSDRGWFDVDLKSLWKYRDLIWLFARRDLTAIYKQTVLGPAWFVIQPLMTTLIFTVIFGTVANLPSDGIPHFLFYLAGTMTWEVLSGVLTKTSKLFIEGKGLFGKVYFPRLATPISQLIVQYASLLIQLGLFSSFFVYYWANGVDISISVWILYYPVAILQITLLAMGIGMIFTSMTTRYRDLNFLVTGGVQLWMYASPVAYPSSMVSANYQGLYLLNPMAPVLEVVRMGLLGSGTINVGALAVSGVVSVAVFFFGLLIFNQVERNFMDTM